MDGLRRLRVNMERGRDMSPSSTSAEVIKGIISGDCVEERSGDGYDEIAAICASVRGRFSL